MFSGMLIENIEALRQLSERTLYLHPNEFPCEVYVFVQDQLNFALFEENIGPPLRPDAPKKKNEY